MFSRQAYQASSFASSSTYTRASNHARQSFNTARRRNAHKPSETTRRCYASLARWMRSSDHGESSSRTTLRVGTSRSSLEGKNDSWTWSGQHSRGMHSSTVSRHGGVTRPAPGTGIKIYFRDSKGNALKTIEANEGDSILDIAHEYDIDLEGACEGSVACSTCHVILDPEHYDMLEEPDDDENDMLDMAFGLTDTSRLGCQVKMSKELDGIVVTLPSATRNMYVDGAKPHTH